VTDTTSRTVHRVSREEEDRVMDTSELPEVTTALLDEARAHSARRAARTLCGGTGHVLRQTAIALLAGSSLSDHENPGEATLQVLGGRVRLSWSDGAVDLGTGGHVVIPQERHGLLALTDAVVLLTAAKS
jgi:quercetin dioxygenase-like cupin family protein